MNSDRIFQILRHCGMSLLWGALSYIALFSLEDAKAVALLMGSMGLLHLHHIAEILVEDPA